MTQVIPFISRHDPRIAMELDEYFPDQIVLTSYLTCALRAHHGTLETARRIAKMLKGEHSRACRPITAEQTERLGIHDHGDEAVARLFSAVEERRPSVATQMLLFGAGNYRRWPKQDQIALIRIYLCALAMFAGVEVDPRQDGSLSGVA
ncbi:hypothetical protein FJZ23_03240 [Candidatus Parcubacteria bacterium]|nr:hypothetical protein [Candidatus Parcubacteria bacterium]